MELKKKYIMEIPLATTPQKVYELSKENIWKVRMHLIGGCMGLTYVEPKPVILKPGKSHPVKQSITDSSTYRLEFVYYLSEEDF